LRDTQVSLQMVEHGWKAHLAGADADGDIGYADDDAGGKLGAKLARLSVEGQPAGDTDKTPSAARAPLEPGNWPALDLSCAQCQLDGADLGALRLVSAHVAGGQRVDEFSLSGGQTEAHASGIWLRQNDLSSAQLKIDLSSANFGGLVKALGYTQNVTARSSRFGGEFEWTPAAGGLEWEQASGKLALEFKKGNLKAVQPGAGRMLGLLNFYALPRRLTLDFHDVVDAGLAFDSISGDFDFGGGNASTSNLKIEGPSLRMEMKGRVGLAARDYDEHVTVVPDISSGVTLGAALLGGPALGALAFVAQEVLDKPISEATQLQYRVTGSWDNPDIKRVEGKAEKTDLPKPAKPGH
ncbi:MAG TPA: AsmA-like C-terminal region-containing protein, partial [Nevskiaceae bacterium]|nr:AsmA-like C-terminal region-containing protein [Nevskiaceae bacterium]